MFVAVAVAVVMSRVDREGDVSSLMTEKAIGEKDCPRSLELTILCQFYGNPDSVHDAFCLVLFPEPPIVRFPVKKEFKNAHEKFATQ